MTLTAHPDLAGWTLIVAERARQITDEGWTADRDDQHVRGELHAAAKAYITAQDCRRTPPRNWPWTPDQWKPRDRASNLRRAGALLLAEADRLARAGHLPAAKAVRTEAYYLAAGLTRLLAASTTRPLPDLKERP